MAKHFHYEIRVYMKKEKSSDLPQKWVHYFCGVGLAQTGTLQNIRLPNDLDLFDFLNRNHLDYKTRGKLGGDILIQRGSAREPIEHC